MDRILKAQEIIDNDRIELLLQNEKITQFYIIGKYGDYLVTCNKWGSWWCSCKDHEHHHATCKHIIAAILKIKGEKPFQKVSSKDGDL